MISFIQTIATEIVQNRVKSSVFYAGLPRPHIMREKTVRRHGNYRLNVLYES